VEKIRILVIQSCFGFRASDFKAKTIFLRLSGVAALERWQNRFG
jgi:hypothetical protein